MKLRLKLIFIGRRTQVTLTFKVKWESYYLHYKIILKVERKRNEFKKWNYLPDSFIRIFNTGILANFS